MTERETEIFQKEALSVGEFAKLWHVPPWVSHMRLHQLERDGVVVSGTVERNFLHANEKADENTPTSEVKAFLTKHELEQ